MFRNNRRIFFKTFGLLTSSILLLLGIANKGIALRSLNRNILEIFPFLLPILYPTTVCQKEKIKISTSKNVFFSETIVKFI